MKKSVAALVTLSATASLLVLSSTSAMALDYKKSCAKGYGGGECIEFINGVPKMTISIDMDVLGSSTATQTWYVRADPNGTFVTVCYASFKISDPPRSWNCPFPGTQTQTVLETSDSAGAVNMGLRDGGT